MRWILALLFLMPMLARAGDLPSDCIALADRQGEVVPVRYGTPPAEGVVRIRYVDHAMFAIETPGGLMAITDYNGHIGNPDAVPDIVTMNNYHDTHFTNHPDPRIPVVIKGWGTVGHPAAVDLDLGEMRIRNVTSDLRGPFGEGARQDGNSIFIFEVAGLCIAHLGHLHQILTPHQLAAIGRVDVLMVPVDGEFTMSQAQIAGVVRALHPRIVLPMHWFTPEVLAQFLTDMKSDHAVNVVGGPQIEVSRKTLPTAPEVDVLMPQPFP
ncbi:Zn-dependent hydrolase [bacterium]|nr:Zn-dependent hydrolase [bacterium]